MPSQPKLGDKLIQGPFVKYGLNLIYSPSETAWFIENIGDRNGAKPDICGPFCHAEVKAKLDEIVMGIIQYCKKGRAD